MAYNIDKLNDRYAVLSGQKKAGQNQKKGPPFQQWKPALTEDGKPRTYNVRFLPYQDQNEQPFQEIAYYDCKPMSSFRLVTPAQFNLPDPIATFVAKLRAQRNNKEAWKIIKELLPKPRYFAPVLVREEMDKGVQIWEFSPTTCKDIYSILVSEDYRDVDLTDPLKGHDFQVTAIHSGKVFKAPNTGKEYPVLDLKIMVRPKPSKLAPEPATVTKLLESIPNLQEIFTRQVKSESELRGMLETFLAVDAPSEPGAEGETSHGPTTADEEAAANKSIDDTFAGL